MSVHPGARDVSTVAVERGSATVTEAHAATEVVMPLDTLRMLADQLYRVLMTIVEGESFNILVGSGSREGLEAWRRLHKRWDPLTTGRARGLLREILPPGRASAKHVELQGAVERLEDLMRRDTQRQDACRRHQDGGVGSASSRRTRATLPTPAVTAGHVPETERRSPPLRGSKRIRCTQPGSRCKGPRGQISSHGCWRIWTMERTTRLQGKGREHHMLDLRENRSTIEGLLGKATAATERRTIKIFWKRKRRRRQVWQRWKERQIQRGRSTCFGINRLKHQLRARKRRLHRRVKQAQQLARSTRLNARRWICVRNESCTLAGKPSMWTLEMKELCGRWMRTTHVKNFQVQQGATAALRQEKRSKEKDGFEFHVRVFGSTNCT